MTTRNRIISLAAMAMLLASCSGRMEGPGDIYNASGTPCVTAHSTTRALFKAYNGPLYQVTRNSDGAKLDIGLTKDGYADAEAQDRFLEGTTGCISIIYDQSGNGNHLYQAGPGTFNGPEKGNFNTLPIADMAPVEINGHKAYGVYIMPGMGFRNNDAKGLAINDEAEGIYYVIDGKHYDSGCCFDYGNSSTNGKAVGTGTMETTYYGISTAWGSGNGDGPWIMADMEAGLFSGYNAKKNDVPSIDWDFVSVYVNGGDGNHWDLRGGDAQTSEVTTFYDGVRPGTPEKDAYYPMSKKGGLLLGNGGDNGNGSAGTFFEGIMTTGYPSLETVEKIQKNIASVRYAETMVEMSRLTSFEDGKSQELTVSLKNTSGKDIKYKSIMLKLPKGWTAEPVNAPDAGWTIQPGGGVVATWSISAPAGMSSGKIIAEATWNGGSRSISQRVRAVEPVKINEVCLNTMADGAKQFIELYNASDKAIDLSGWKLRITHSGWAGVDAMTFPQGTSIAAKSHLLLNGAQSYLAAAANAADDVIFVSGEGLKAGDKLTLGNESVTIKEVRGTAGSPAVIFTPVSTGPWMDVPAGSTNIPVNSVAGMNPGDKIGIDLGGNFETSTIVSVGKPATQTVLSEAVKAGQTIIKLECTDKLDDGSVITIGTGLRKDVVKIKKVITSVAEPQPRRFGMPEPPVHVPGEVELEEPLKYDQIASVDVSCPGSGITINPGLKFAHRSGDAIQSLGAGVVLDAPLASAHGLFAVVGASETMSFGYSLSPTAGSIVLYDPSGEVVVDAIVYGSQQSNSSANGTIADPVIATLEGIQTQGGSIAVVPQAPRWNPRMGGTAPVPTPKSLVRIPDGADSDRLSIDFQTSETLTPGTANVK